MGLSLGLGLGLNYTRSAGGGVSLLAINRALLNNGDGLVLDFLSDTAYVKDSGTPANDYNDRTRDLLTVTNTIKSVTGPDGNLRYQAHNLITKSQTFEDWTPSSSGTGVAPSVSDNSSAAPDGTATAALVTLNRGAGNTLSDESSIATPAFTATAFGHKGGCYFKAATVDDIGKEIAIRHVAAGSYDVCTLTDTWQLFTGEEVGLPGSRTLGITNRGTITADNSVSFFVAAARVFRTPADETYVATTSSARYGMPIDHDVTTLDACSTSVNVGTGKRTLTLDGSTDYRTATTAWADATSYSIGDQRQVSNRSYTCIVAHTSSAPNKPSGEGNAYWKRDEKTLRISDQSDVDGKYLIARVDYQSGTTLVVDVLRVVGSGSASSWHVIEAKGVLIEEAGTNIITHSNGPFNVFPWNASGSVTITANAAVAPDGTTTASRVVTSGSSSTRFTSTVTAETAYTFTFYVKNNGGTVAKYRVYDDTNTADIVAATSYFSEISNTDYTRIKLAFTTPVGCVTASVYIESDTGGMDAFVWGTQLEAGSFPTSYIATAGATVTRSADALSLATSAFAFSATEGMVYVDGAWDAGSAVNANGRTLAALSDGTANEVISIYNASGRAGAYIADGGVSQAVYSVATIAADVPTRIALAMKVNDINIAVDGVAGTQDTSATLPTVTSLKIGMNAIGAGQLNGHIRSLVYTPTRESNAALQARAA